MDKATIILTIISLFLALVSLAAIVLSVITYVQSSKTALKVSSKEHEISENLKSKLLELVAILRFIDRKAASIDYYEKKQNFSYEIERLSKIQMSPEFLLFLDSSKLDTIDEEISKLIELLLSDKIDAMNNIRVRAKLILDNLGKVTKVENDTGVDVVAILKEWCSKDNTYIESNPNKSLIRRKERNRELAFLENLISNGNTDDDVRYIYNVLFETLHRNSINIGMNTNYMVTRKEVLKKYQLEYEKFCKTLKKNKGTETKSKKRN